MHIFHSTDDAGREAIERKGFAVTFQGDHSGDSWFALFRDRQVTASRKGWWVVVEMPEEVVRAHHEPPDPYKVRIPFSVVNQYGPFAYERWGEQPMTRQPPAYLPGWVRRES